MQVEIRKCLAILCEIHEKDLNRAKLYEDILKDEDQEKVLNSLKKLIKTSKFFPKIPEILNFKENNDDKLEGKWLEFKANMFNDLHYQEIPNWVMGMKRNLGISRCNNIKPEEEQWLRKDFIATYPSFLKNDSPKLIEEANLKMLCE